MCVGGNRVAHTNINQRYLYGFLLINRNAALEMQMWLIMSQTHELATWYKHINVNFYVFNLIFMFLQKNNRFSELVEG